MWSWQTRFVFMSLLRKVDRAGMIDVGAYGLKGLAVALAAPIEIVEAGVAELLSDGTIKQAGSMFVIPNFLHAQECSQSDRARKRAERERDRAHAIDSADVTNRDDESRSVTKSHAESHAVTSGHTESQPVTPCRAVPSRTEPSRTPLPPSGARRRSRDPIVVTPEARAVFDHWRVVMKKNVRTELDDKRARAIQARLDGGYTVDDLRLAIDGCRRTPHNMGDNENGALYNDIELICRSAPNVDRFKASAPKPPPANDPPQPERKQATPEQIAAFQAARSGRGLFEQQPAAGDNHGS
jgi:hypothetical protein